MTQTVKQMCEAHEDFLKEMDEAHLRRLEDTLSGHRRRIERVREIVYKITQIHLKITGYFNKQRQESLGEAEAAVGAIAAMRNKLGEQK